MISRRSYARDQVAAFLRTGDAFGAFSNMHAGFPLRVAELDVPATENYYQAMRYPHRPDVQEAILAERHPVQAKRLAYRSLEHSRGDWQAVNIALMRHALRLRYAHHPHAMQDLFRETGGRPIVEISRRDDFWGTRERGDLLEGRNVLGRLWMELREEVADRDPDTPFEVGAPEIPDLILCDRPVTTFTPRPVMPAQASLDI